MEVGEEGGEVVVELGLELSLPDLGLLERKDVLKERNGEAMCIVAFGYIMELEAFVRLGFDCWTIS